MFFFKAYNCHHWVHIQKHNNNKKYMTWIHESWMHHVCWCFVLHVPSLCRDRSTRFVTLKQSTRHRAVGGSNPRREKGARWIETWRSHRCDYHDYHENIYMYIYIYNIYIIYIYIYTLLIIIIYICIIICMYIQIWVYYNMSLIYIIMYHA